MKRHKKNRLNQVLQVFIEGTKRQRKLRDALVPRISRVGDACFDLYVAQDTVIPPGLFTPTDVPSGIRVKLPRGTDGEIKSRSGTYSNYPTLLIRSSPIDENYIGPLSPRFINLGTEPVTVKRGERLAQLKIYKTVLPKIRVVEKLPKTNRGSRRYGSSGR